jgi:hypothetical protein
LTTAGLALWTALLWQSEQPYPSECRAARPWQWVQEELPGILWVAWNLLVWHVLQLVIREPRLLACSALL